MSVVGLTQVVFALALDGVLFNRSFNLATLLGMGLVMAPTAWLMTYRTPETLGEIPGLNE